MAPRLRGCRDRAVHQGGRGEWSSGVMDEHDVGLEPLQGGEAGAHRTLAGVAAAHRRQQVEAGGGARKQVRILAVDNWLDDVDPGMVGEQRQARADHRDTGYRPVLLRSFSAGAKPAAARHDHGCHHCGHHCPSNVQFSCGFPRVRCREALAPCRRAENGNHRR